MDYGTGRIVVADSWFGSVKSAIALMKKGLYANMLVKTAHKGFPRNQLSEKSLSRGEWVAYHSTIEDVNLQVRFF